MNGQNCEDEDYNRFFIHISEDELTESEKKFLHTQKMLTHKHNEYMRMALVNILNVRCIEIQKFLLSLMEIENNKEMNNSLVFIN